MTEHRDHGPALHLVPAAQPDPADAPEATPDDTAPVDGTPPADEGPDEADAPRDPLLARAERIAELPLEERPAAFDGLNRAVVAELNTLEEG